MMMKVTRTGDSDLKVGQVVEWEEFVSEVNRVISQGGEMPSAIRVHEEMPEYSS